MVKRPSIVSITGSFKCRQNPSRTLTTIHNLKSDSVCCCPTMYYSSSHTSWSGGCIHIHTANASAPAYDSSTVCQAYLSVRRAGHSCVAVDAWIPTSGLLRWVSIGAVLAVMDLWIAAWQDLQTAHMISQSVTRNQLHYTQLHCDQAHSTGAHKQGQQVC